MRVISRIKFLTIIVLSFFVLSSKGQVYQVMPQFGYKFNRVAVDSTLHIPSYCGVPSITDYIKNGMIAIDTCNNVLFQWTRSNGWTPISTGTYLDTTSLSNRINQRVKYTDTSAMLNPYLKKTDTLAMLSRYLRKSDTASLSNRINLKVNISDTAAMLSKYLRRSDTTSMLNPYLRKVDTASISNRINLKVNISDTSTMLLPYLRKADTTAMLSKYLRKSDTASLSNRINLKLNISDTSAMLSKYLRIVDTATMLSKYVPYIGANKDVNLGNYKLSTSATQFSLSSEPSYSQGLIWYDSTQKSLAFYNDASYTPIYIGENIVFKVYNNTGSTISKGAAVYIKSAGSFTYPNVGLAKADSISTSAVIGLMNGSTPSGSFGYVTSTGVITGVNTGAYSEGTILYLSPYSSGQLMNTVPPTGYAVQVGVVAHSNNPNGTIYTKQTTPLAISASTIVGGLTTSQGGTGSTSSLNQGGIVYGSTANTMSTTSAGTTGKVLTSNGTSAPTWTNKVDTIYRTPGKDSIIFTINGTIRAIKDSTGGSPSPNNGSIQFNKNGAFGADSALHWNNNTKVLSIGTTSDLVGNYPGDLVIQGNTTGTGVGRIIVGGTGAYQDLIFTKTNAFEQQKAWAFGSRYDSYFNNEEGAFSLIGVNADDNLVVPIIANPSGNLVLAGAGNAINGNVSVGVPMDAGYKFEVNGSAYIDAGVTINGGLYTNQSVHKHILFVDDIDTDSYYATDQDNVIIYNTDLDNASVYLPDAPVQGQEIIIKQRGATQTYFLYVYGNGHDIWYDETTQSSIQVPDTAPHSITLIYDSTGDGFWYVLNY